MKTFLTRTLPLLLSIVVGTAISWVSIYAFWFAIWGFHSVPAARAFDALGAFILLPAKWVFELLGCDQSAIFFDPTSFSGTNGLIVGILIYSVFRAIWSRHEAAEALRHEPAGAPRVEAKVG